MSTQYKRNCAAKWECRIQNAMVAVGRKNEEKLQLILKQKHAGRYCETLFMEHEHDLFKWIIYELHDSGFIFPRMAIHIKAMQMLKKRFNNDASF